MKQPLNLAAFTAALLACQLALAGIADEVESPDVEKGEAEVEVRFGQARDRGQTVERGYAVGAGYGVTRSWSTEASLEYRRDGNGATELDTFEWENKFQFTDSDIAPFGITALVEIERPRDHAEGWEVRVGPLLQSEVGRFVLNANVLFEKSFRAESKVETEWETLYQWQARYRLGGAIDIGVQGFADERASNAGPVLFGDLGLGDEQTLKYNIGWLKGLNDETPSHTLRVQLELEFE
jgi:hypothetical protein